TVTPLADTPAPADDVWREAAAHTFELAQRYARTLGLQEESISAIGRGSEPGEIADELAQICRDDVVRAILGELDPLRRLAIVRAALEQLLDVGADLRSPRGEPASPAAAHLVVVAEREGNCVGERFAVRHDVTTVGRATRSDVCLPLESVSRHHCTIRCVAGQFEVSDESSTNGVFVNDGEERIHRTVLRDRDHLRVGTATLQLVAGIASPGPTANVDARHWLARDECAL
ncbi:MAG: FHA domain-containing protein, partial [Myxococcota bacterium]